MGFGIGVGFLAKSHDVHVRPEVVVPSFVIGVVDEEVLELGEAEECGGGDDVDA